MEQHEKITYLELQSTKLTASKAFFQQAFAWSFTDYGDSYSAFHGAGIEGGLYPSDQANDCAKGGVLVVFYSHDLEATQAKIQRAGGAIIKAIFSFPGGRRFHFQEPGGNELAVWSDREAE